MFAAPPVAFSPGLGRDDDDDLFGVQAPQVEQNDESDDVLAAAASNDLEAPAADNGAARNGAARVKKKSDGAVDITGISSEEDDEEEVEYHPSSSSEDDHRKDDSGSEDDGGAVEMTLEYMAQLLVEAGIDSKRARLLCSDINPATGLKFQLAKVKDGHLTWNDFFEWLKNEQNAFARKSKGAVKPFVFKTATREAKRDEFQANMSKFVPWLLSLVKQESSPANRPQRSRKRSAAEEPSQETQPTPKKARTETPKKKKKTRSKDMERDQALSQNPQAGSNKDVERDQALAENPQAGSKEDVYDVEKALKEACTLAELRLFKYSSKKMTREDIAEMIETSVVHSTDGDFVVVRRQVPGHSDRYVDFRFLTEIDAHRWMTGAAAMQSHIELNSNDLLEQLALPPEKLANWIIYAMVFFPHGQYTIPEPPIVSEFDFGQMI